jgi:hypothetical protein
MTISSGSLSRSLFGVPYKIATAFRQGTSETWMQLEAAVLAALEGYHAILEGSAFQALIPRLDTVPLELRGYAYEGAAMGLTGLDLMLPWKKRLLAYMAGPGAPHIYMVHIGAGEALARLRRRPEPFIARLPDRVLCWLVMDGYGFHEGFFASHRTIDRQFVPKHLSNYARHIFDQGVGRSLWFTAGADIERISSSIAAFPISRQADMWAGVGVGCTYVGGIDEAGIKALRWASGPYSAELAMGSATVAKGRLRAGNPAPHSNLACKMLCEVSSEEAAQMVDKAFMNLPLDGPEPAFAILQRRIKANFVKEREEEKV